MSNNQKLYTYIYSYSTDGKSKYIDESHSHKVNDTLYRSGYQKKFNGKNTAELFYDNEHSDTVNREISGNSRNRSDWTVTEKEDDIRMIYIMDYKNNKYFQKLQNNTSEHQYSEPVKKNVRRSKRLIEKKMNIRKNKISTKYITDTFLNDSLELNKNMENKSTKQNTNLYNDMY